MFLLIRHQIKFLSLSLLLISLATVGCVSGTNASHAEANASNLNGVENQPALLTQNTAQPAQDVTADQVYKVVRVVDGDTVIILIDGKQTRVRLIGVDTPETVHPQKPVEALGKEASQFTKNLLEGESVYSSIGRTTLRPSQPNGLRTGNRASRESESVSGTNTVGGNAWARTRTK